MGNNINFNFNFNSANTTDLWAGLNSTSLGGVKEAALLAPPAHAPAVA